MKTKVKRRLWRDRLAADMKRPGFAEAFEKERTELRVAAEIAEAREIAGLTQGELAKAIATTQSTVCRIEKGRQNLTLSTLEKIAKATGTSLQIKLVHADTLGDLVGADEKLKDKVVHFIAKKGNARKLKVRRA